MAGQMPATGGADKQVCPNAAGLAIVDERDHTLPKLFRMWSARL